MFHLIERIYGIIPDTSEKWMWMTGTRKKLFGRKDEKQW